MTRIICVRLIRWPIDRIRRRQPALRREPLVLVETVGGTRQLVASVCEQAQASGIQPGMTLTQARALCPGLAHAAHEPDHDRRALDRLGRWLTRFSPVVSSAPPNALFVDVGGCERLWGGDLGKLAGQMTAALRAVRVAARLALAPNPGAAWAFAATNKHDDPAIVTAESLTDRLATLPPSALRLDLVTSAMLDGLGVETIGQLDALPRDTLPARFGTALLTRLDAAFGRIPEPLTPLPYRELIHAVMTFDYAVTSLEAVWLVLRELLGQLVPQLARRGLGAREVRAEFRRPYKPSPDVKAIHLSRPSRDSAALFNLLRCALESIGVDEGFVAVRLAVTRGEQLADAQLLLLGREERESDDDLARLVDTLTASLGADAVVRPALVASNLPERACRVTEAIAAPTRSRNEPPPPDQGPRPLRLFPTPVEVTVVAAPSPDGDGSPALFTHEREVHRLTHVDGPERIAGMWWEGRGKTRDYFDAEDQAGRRFWLFRVLESGRWFLHGVFE